MKRCDARIFVLGFALGALTLGLASFVVGAGAGWDIKTSSGDEWRPAGWYAADAPILEYASTVEGGVVHWKRGSAQGRKLLMRVGNRDGNAGQVQLFDSKTVAGDTQPDVGVQLNPEGDSYFMGGDVGFGTRFPTGAVDVNGDHVRVREPKTKGQLGLGEMGEIAWVRGDDGRFYLFVNVDGARWKGVELNLSE